MIRRTTGLLVTLLFCVAFNAAAAATLSPTLQSKLTQVTNSTSVGLVIVAFNTNNGLSAAHLDLLRGIGITKGTTLQRLGMVAVVATAGQVRALAANPAVQLALDNGIPHARFSTTQGPFDPFPVLHASVKPNDLNTRAATAYALGHYRQHFVAGN